jgi:predicted alpha/beta superfamily hydrolase
MKQYLGMSALWVMALAGGAACAHPSHPASHPAVEIAIGKEISLDSAILREKRTIQIALPRSYADSHTYTRYPVLYMLDGHLFFEAVTGDVRYLSGDASPRIPEMIVVGIPSEHRVRDSSPSRSLKGPLGKEDPAYEVSGGADRFLRFLTDELAPYIDRTYSTSGYRVLAGYSFTGLAVMHAAFTRPEAFHGYVAIDPSWWWDDYLLEKEASAFIANAKLERMALFVTTTTNNPPEPYLPNLRYVDTLSAMLDARPVHGLRFGMKIYDDETHHSLTLRSIRDGLGHIFAGYAPSLETLYAHPERLEDQYRQLSARLGTEVFLQEGLVNYFGTTFLKIYSEIDKAILCFQLNTRRYPRSAGAWESLGEAYAVAGDRAMAIESYAKSLELDPRNGNAARQLDKLRAAARPQN